MNIIAYCDGSGTLPTGPACIGVTVFLDGAIAVEASAFLGLGTNNYAELIALRRAMFLLEQMFTVDQAARVCSDSAYALEMVQDPRRFPNANEAVVKAAREQYARFRYLEFVHVPGHSGVYGNELADWLAGEARTRWLASQGIVMSTKKKRRARPEPPAPREEPKPNSPEDVGFPARTS